VPACPLDRRIAGRHILSGAAGPGDAPLGARTERSAVTGLPLTRGFW
jgi:hypothetical protein